MKPGLRSRSRPLRGSNWDRRCPLCQDARAPIPIAQATFPETKKKPPPTISLLLCQLADKAKRTAPGCNRTQTAQTFLLPHRKKGGPLKQKTRRRIKKKCKKAQQDNHSARVAIAPQKKIDRRRRTPAWMIYAFTRHKYQLFIRRVTVQSEQIDVSTCQEAARQRAIHQRAHNQTHIASHTHIRERERGEEEGSYLVGTYFGNKR